MNVKTIVGAVLLAGFGYLVVDSFSEQVTGYETFGEAVQNGKRAHIVGEWLQAQPTGYDAQANAFTFFMKDEAGETRQVVYRNPKPANFEDAEKVVVEGHMAGDVFEAEHILVKCPSKYNDAAGDFQPASFSEEAPTRY